MEADYHRLELDARLCLIQRLFGLCIRKVNKVIDIFIHPNLIDIGSFMNLVIDQANKVSKLIKVSLFHLKGP